jgi:DNA-binding FadR family transcriptional regulator
MTPVNLPSELLNYLATSDFQPGDRLPTLSELQKEEYLNISISKIREQLEVARAMGLVEVRSKTGMRLNPFSFTPAIRLSLLYALAMDVHHFEHIGSVRVHLETAYWDEACAKLTTVETAIMREQIEAARAKLADARWIQIPHEEHRTFHLTVFTHLDNPFVIDLLKAYWDAYEAAAITRYADFSYHQKVWDFHERILDEICAGNYADARLLFVEHTELLHVQPVLQPASERDED